MPDILRSPALAKARRVAREWSDTHVERPVARAYAEATALKRSAPDVLYFGDSSLIFVSPQDKDQRRLGEMMAGSVDGTLRQYYGPGYSVELWSEFARLMKDLPRPRVIIVPMCVRPGTHRHITDHPVFGYASASAALRNSAKVGPRLLTKLYKKPASKEAYAAFEATAHAGKWPLAATMGEYRRLLRGYNPATAGEDDQRLLYAYFHGEYSADHPTGTEHWSHLGARLRALDVPVVAYRTNMCLSHGDRLLGEEFTQHVEANFQSIEGAFFSALGGGTKVEFPPPTEDMYLTKTDGTEHYNETGRRYIVDTVAPVVNDLLR